MSFDDLGLSPDILKAVADVGYTTPTPIQEQAIPHVLTGRDVLGIAQTGTGKTASFTLPMVHVLASGRARARMPRSLILVPTRELAHQVADNFTLYSKYLRLSMALLIGGESLADQERALSRGVDVLIATPGRLRDLFERGSIILHDVKILVIDEADRMMDMGFIPDVTRIVSFLPGPRQTLFFSATMNDEIRQLADSFLHDPHEVRVSPRASAAETVDQKMVHVPSRNAKRQVLRHLLATEDVRSAFVFCNRKRDVSLLFYSLERHGFQPVHLHGDMTQPQRLAALATFKEGQSKVMVCSDVAARGIDVSDVSHVFNFDIPFHAEDYIHRIGRTGRAGRVGVSWSLATADDEKQVAAIEKLIGRAIPVVEVDIPGLANAEEQPSAPESTETSASGGSRSSRSGGRRPARTSDASRKRRGRPLSPADQVPEVDHADGVAAFGGLTPDFLTAPLTATEERALFGGPVVDVGSLSGDLLEDEAEESTEGGVSDVVAEGDEAGVSTAPKASRSSRSRSRRRRFSSSRAVDTSSLPEEGETDVLAAEPETEPDASQDITPKKSRSRRTTGRRKKKVEGDSVGQSPDVVSSVGDADPAPPETVVPVAEDSGTGGARAVEAEAAEGHAPTEEEPRPPVRRRRRSPRRRTAAATEEVSDSSVSPEAAPPSEVGE